MQKANLKCPFCGYIEKLDIPENSCLSYHRCSQCKKNIHGSQKSGGSCIICEYTDKKCPFPC